MRMNKLIIIGQGALFLLLVSTTLFAANDVVNTVTMNSVSQNTVETSSRDQGLVWGLTESEWAYYQSLMQGVNGHYYMHLTPPEVLGINAKTPQDIKYFAELAAKQEHDKIEKELRFNAAFYAAAQRLYANEPMIKPFDLTPYTPIH